jgi:hypothetical protein
VSAAAASPDRTADLLRDQMVATLVGKGVVRSPQIVQALRAVPRHLVDPQRDEHRDVQPGPAGSGGAAPPGRHRRALTGGPGPGSAQGAGGSRLRPSPTAGAEAGRVRIAHNGTMMPYPPPWTPPPPEDDDRSAPRTPPSRASLIVYRVIMTLLILAIVVMLLGVWLFSQMMQGLGPI